MGGVQMRSKLNYDMLHPTYKALYDIVGEDNLLKIYELFRGDAVTVAYENV